MLRVRLLGGLTLEADGGPLAVPASRPARELLAWLALHPGPQPRFELALRFWPEVLEMIADAESRGITSRVTDGFAAGDRAALTVTCSYAGGGQVLCNALLDLRDGNIVRWFSVQAWDD